MIIAYDHSLSRFLPPIETLEQAETVQWDESLMTVAPFEHMSYYIEHMFERSGGVSYYSVTVERHSQASSESG